MKSFCIQVKYFVSLQIEIRVSDEDKRSKIVVLTIQNALQGLPKH